jgi:hypothetical protein
MSAEWTFLATARRSAVVRRDVGLELVLAVDDVGMDTATSTLVDVVEEVPEAPGLDETILSVLAWDSELDAPGELGLAGGCDAFGCAGVMITDSEASSTAFPSSAPP